MHQNEKLELCGYFAAASWPCPFEKKIAKTLDVLSPEDYVRWQYEYAVLDSDGTNDDGSPDLSSYEDYFGLFGDIDLYRGQPANDWQRQIYGRQKFKLHF